MKILLLFAATALVGCSTSKEIAKSVAQCQLDADSPAGLAFRKGRMGADFDRYSHSYDYNVFMLKCMQANGFEFPKEGDANAEGCYEPGADKNPAVDTALCYMKI